MGFAQLCVVYQAGAHLLLAWVETGVRVMLKHNALESIMYCAYADTIMFVIVEIFNNNFELHTFLGNKEANHNFDSIKLEYMSTHFTPFDPDPIVSPVASAILFDWIYLASTKRHRYPSSILYRVQYVYLPKP